LLLLLLVLLVLLLLCCCKTSMTLKLQDVRREELRAMTTSCDYFAAVNRK
jgi:hypothetical protein